MSEPVTKESFLEWLNAFMNMPESDPVTMQNVKGERVQVNPDKLLYVSWPRALHAIEQCPELVDSLLFPIAE